VFLGLRKSRNWVQLARFIAVGASGYLINLAVFAVCVHVFDFDFRLAAVAAFVVAVSSNFVCNRHWTFDDARDGHAGHQAARFLAVSVAAFLVNLAVLDLLVTVAGLPEVVAQAIAVATATPCNFVGNKLWTFGA
jgi:dolichol-phosphate mannosyltransferase